MANLLVIVSYKVFPAHMGGQKGVVKFYENLEAYHSVFLAVSADNDLQEENLAVEKILFANRKIWRNIGNVRRLLRLIKSRNIDCIIAEHSYTGWIAYLLKKLSGKPFIIHSHNIEASRFRQMGRRGWRLYSRYESWIHRRADFSFFKTREEEAIAHRQFGLSGSKTAIVSYGIDHVKNLPDAPAKLRLHFGVSRRYIFYFNGTMDYEPNMDAVQVMVEKLNPLLLESGLDFTILVSGKRLPLNLQEKIKRTSTIRYLDFVEEVELLYQGCDLFLNPVVNDSGVKTKVIEAIANGCTVVSTAAGASGVPPDLCKQKLQVVEDGNWKAFAETIQQLAGKTNRETPPDFTTYFSWKNIALNAAQKIDSIL